MELITELFDTIKGHWPLLVVALILAFIGQFAKGSVFTKARIEEHWVAYHRTKSKGSLFLNKFFWWGRKSLALHPFVTGIGVGFVPGIPTGPGIETLAARVLYFAGAGILSVFLFDILKGFAKKHGIDLKLPGVASSPPPVEEEKTPVDGST